jgi:hypothetical protein
VPAPLKFRTLEEARAAAAAAGGRLRDAPEAPAGDPHLERLSAALERIGEVVARQGELISRLAQAPTPTTAPAPPVEVRVGALEAAPPPAPMLPIDATVVRDPRTRLVSELQLRRAGDPASATVVRIERDRGTKQITMLRVIPAARAAN